MFTVHLAQAGRGDCLALEAQSPSGRQVVLIDGGPAGVFDRHLRPLLASLGGAPLVVDLVALSHVDDDHVAGLIDLFEWLAREREAGRPEPVRLSAVWHNAFSQTVRLPEADRGLARRALPAPARERAAPQLDPGGAFSIAQGDALQREAAALGVPVNPGFQDGLVMVRAGQAPRDVGAIRFTVLGPSKKSLDALGRKWRAWLREQRRGLAALREDEAPPADTSVPNLSSLMLLAESGGRSVLLPGDARGDQLVDGLKLAGRWPAAGAFHAAALKLPHHGGSRNVTRAFFRRVIADRYLVSGDGADGNPDLTTLRWLVEAAREDGRRFEILATNPTGALDSLVREYPPESNGFSIRLPDPGAHAISVALADAPVAAEAGVIAGAHSAAPV